MTDYFVASGGSNTSPYDTWAKAATSLQTALTAASGGSDRVILQYDGVPSGDAEMSADTTYSFAANAALICSTNSGTATVTPTVMGTGTWVGNSTTNRYVRLEGGFKVYVYGLTLRTAGTTADSISIARTNDADHILESCYLWNGNTATTSFIEVGASALTNSAATLIDCTLRFGHADQRINNFAKLTFRGGSIGSAGTVPAIVFGTSCLQGFVELHGVDLSAITGSLVGNQSGGYNEYRFVNCKLGSGVTIMDAQTSNPNHSACNVWVYNCSSGDQHYHMGHYNAMGSTIVDTGIYANDGAQYDGTNYCSWKIVSTANSRYYNPYYSPWIDCYHSGTSAITPSLEILRSGSATAYQNDEVWGEFSYQGTSGFPLATIVSDRMALEGTAADQTTGALSASGWTGENATSWFGKLNPTSTITPAEIGHLRARVVVGEPSITVYVDPTIRDRS